MRLRAAATLLGLWAIPTSCLRGQGQPADTMVRVGSHRLEVRSEGTGSPVVVIETGIGDRMDKVRPLQQRLAQRTRVITYNRAGYGRSEPGPLPRDAAHEADDLKALLDGLAVNQPVVLVGHSLGALDAQAFASRYPDAVAGLVLLDPPPLTFLLGQEYDDLRAMAEGMTAQWQATGDAAAASSSPQDRAMGAFLHTIASEHREMFGASARLVDGITSFGDLPLVVMAAGKPNPAFGAVAGEYQRYWIEQSRLLGRKSARGRFVLAENASHYLYRDEPDLVAREILSVVDTARHK